MNRKQKEQLRFYRKARRRAEKVLADRRAIQQNKLERSQLLDENRQLVERYSAELTDLAVQSGLLQLAQELADFYNGALSTELSCHVDYGLSTSAFQRVLAEGQRGKIKPSYLAVRIRWQEADQWQQVETRVYPNGRITVQHFLLPLLPFFWRRNRRLLPTLLAYAVERPTTIAPPQEERHH